MSQIPRPEHEFCEIRGGTPQMAMMGGDLPVDCPSYCKGPTEIIIESPLVFGKFGPAAPALAITCPEAEQPKILHIRTAMGLLRYLRDR